jgi:hypothetical protein
LKDSTPGARHKPYTDRAEVLAFAPVDGSGDLAKDVRRVKGLPPVCRELHCSLTERSASHFLKKRQHHKVFPIL